MSHGTSILPTAAHGLNRQELAEIDRSVRLPVLLFFGTAIFWLLVSSLLGVLNGIQVACPAFLADIPFLTYGRLYPACVDAGIYGWASAAGIGAGVWLISRLCGVALRRHALLVVAAIFWNLGVLLGVLSILAGYSQSIPWLEFPSFASGFLLVAYILIAVWGIVIFRFRRQGAIYASQWYLFAAFLCFPWLYASANTFLTWNVIQGSAVATIAWWYVQGLFGLWFVPLGLALAYYLIPRIVGEPVHRYRLSIYAFWTLLLFFAWSGMRYLFGGPVPAWMGSISVVAGILLLIPVILIGINHHVTMEGRYGALAWSPTLRFVVFGAGAFTLTGIDIALMSIPAFNSVIQFTDWVASYDYLGLYAFFSMTMFGAIYYIVPNLIGVRWACSCKINAHFWLSAVGVSLVVLTLGFTGLMQGLSLGDEGISFTSVLMYVTPFRVLAAVCGLCMVLGNLIFAVNFVQTVLRWGTEETASPAAVNDEEVVRI